MIQEIGKIFEYEGKKLKVVECEDCFGCYFLDLSLFVPCTRPEDSDIVGVCEPYYRDGKGVKFVEVKGGVK